MSTMTNPPHEAVEIDVNSIETNATRLVCLIKPTWISKNLIIKKFGIDNNNIYYSIYPSEEEDEQHGVVMKIYPTNSDVYNNQQTVFQLIDQLSQHGIAPNILLTFNNGYISNFFLGKTLDINEEHTQQLIAQKLAEFHSMPWKFNNGPNFVNKLKDFIDLFTTKNLTLQNRLVEIKEESSNPNNQNLLTSFESSIGLSSTPSFPLTLNQLESELKDTSWAELSTEIDFIRTLLENNWSKHNLPIVLCLNNINISNFLYDSKNKTISIIDFDHCSSNYFLIDIVSYFLELGKDDYDNKYPSRSIQKLFLIEYLKYSSLNLSNFIYDPLKPTNHELENICDLCGLLIAPIHLYWALWAFLQALLTNPTSTFDFINYGKIRLAQYQKHKNNFFIPLYQSQKS